MVISGCSDYLAGKGQHISRSWGDKEHIRQILETFINLDLKKNIERALDWLEFYNKTMTIILVSLTCSCGKSFADYLDQIEDLGCEQFGGGCVYKLGMGDTVAKCGPIKPFSERQWVDEEVDEEVAEEGDLREERFLLTETDMRYIFDENKDAEDTDQEDYIPPPESIKQGLLRPPNILIVSPPTLVTKKKKQVLLLQEDDSGIRSTYKTQSRPTYHRLRPRAQVEKKYKHIGRPDRARLAK